MARRRDYSSCRLVEVVGSGRQRHAALILQALLRWLMPGLLADRLEREHARRIRRDEVLSYIRILESAILEIAKYLLLDRSCIQHHPLSPCGRQMNSRVADDLQRRFDILGGHVAECRRERIRGGCIRRDNRDAAV